MKDAEVVITNTYRTQMVEHAYLEPEAGVARYEDGKLTIWMPNQIRPRRPEGDCRCSRPSIGSGQGRQCDDRGLLRR